MPSVTGLDRQAEQRAQDQILSRLEQKHAPAVEAEITRAIRDSLTNPRTWMIDHFNRLASVCGNIWSDSGKRYIGRLTVLVKADPRYMERKDAFDVLFGPTTIDELIAEWIRGFGGRRISMMAQTTQQQIADAVAAGRLEGLSETGITDMILRLAPDMARYRAATIARTESHVSGQGVQVAAAIRSEIDVVKVWVSAENERTREAHRLASGQKVDPSGFFIVGGEALAHPGDPNGTAANVINCRCCSVIELA